MHQIRFRLGLHSRPHWGSLQRSPDSYLDFRGPTSKGSEGRGRGKKGKGREGNEKGEGGRPPPHSQFATPLGQASHSRRPGLGDLTWLEDFLTLK